MYNNAPAKAGVAVIVQDSQLATLPIWFIINTDAPSYVMMIHYHDWLSLKITGHNHIIIILLVVYKQQMAIWIIVESPCRKTALTCTKNDSIKAFRKLISVPRHFAVRQCC